MVETRSRKTATVDAVASTTASKADASDSAYERENIFLFMPNVIGRDRAISVVCLSVLIRLWAGYLRIVLAVASLYYMGLHPRTCSLLYSVSCLLDALDGYAARYYEQSTRFGAVLDMVTDRCTTSCLL